MKEAKKRKTEMKNKKELTSQKSQNGKPCFKCDDECAYVLVLTLIHGVSGIFGKLLFVEMRRTDY